MPTNKTAKVAAPKAFGKFLTIPLAKIKPAKYNPKAKLERGEPEYEAIKRSLEEFSLVVPLVWNQHNGILIDGHQRFGVMKDLGYKTALVSAVDIKDPMRERALNRALDKIKGRVDDRMLAALLEEINGSEIDFALTGYTEGDLDEIIARIKVPEGFDKVGPDISVKHTCPKCGFKFS